VILLLLNTKNPVPLIWLQSTKAWYIEYDKCHKNKVNNMLRRSEILRHNSTNTISEKQTNSELVLVDTFSGRVHIDWEPNAAVTPN
jgi:hypothetical protein